MADIRSLFPEMFKANHTYNCAIAYEKAIKRGLNGITSNFHSTKYYSEENQKKATQNLQGELVSIWESAEKPLSNAILDGTVDSIPEIWISNQSTIHMTKTSKRYDEEEEDFVEETKTTSRTEIAVDYFECAKVSLDRAKKYDPLESISKHESKPGEFSGLYNTFRHLYAYKNVKTQSIFDKFFFFFLAVIESLIVAGYAFWFNHGRPIFLAHFIVYITGLIAIPTFIALIRRIPKYLKLLFFGRIYDKMTLETGKKNLSDGQKLLAYYRIWHNVFTHTYVKGVDSKSDQDSSKTSLLQRNFDEALKEMEEVVNFVRNN